MTAQPSGFAQVSKGGFAAAADDVVAHLQRVAPLVRWEVIRHRDGSEADEPPSAELRARRAVAGTCFGIAIRQPDGRLGGALWGLHPAARPGELGELLTLAETLARVLGHVLAAERSVERERMRAERAELRAVTDGLTGIGNRLGWEEALAVEEARANRRGLWTGLVSVDLDELKEVNDRAGHAAGDRLLTATARSMQSVVRRDDVLARVGGDEFAVLVADCERASLDRLVTRLRSVLEVVQVRASIGAVSVPPGTPLREAWQRADQQMYADKRDAPRRRLDVDLTQVDLTQVGPADAPDADVDSDFGKGRAAS